MADSTVRNLLAAVVTALEGTFRTGQIQMTEEVAQAIQTGEHLLVQAGTGTGKSLAYLVPALVHSMGGGGERVVVATATLALQHQLVERDLPRTSDVLAEPLGRRPEYVPLKGRHNYLCVQRVREGSVEDEPALFDATSVGQLGQDVLRLREWGDETKTGDRDELPFPVNERAWAQVSVTASECVGAARCRYGKECFTELARERARHADVVVTNHAMLAIDALKDGSILPEHDVVVVDEAHELVSRVTKAATEELTPSMLSRAVRRCARLVDQSVIDALGTAGETLSELLVRSPSGRLEQVAGELADGLVAVRDAARAVISALSEPTGEQGELDYAERAVRQQAQAAVETICDVAERVLIHDAADVTWIEHHGQRGSALAVAPLSVAEMLRDKLFALRTVILTSATLEIGGQFDGVAQAVGLLPALGSATSQAADPSAVTAASPDASALPAWRGIDVGSPFDYPRQGILYVAKHLPPPGREGTSPATLDELAGLIEAAGGRALGLFSSMRAAQTAAQALRERLDVPLLCQGEDSLGELLRAFAADARTCLFGTLSLWQGVDVPGSACQLVVIDRIPFPRPDNPLMSARKQAVDDAGGNGFLAVAASHAALLLAQGSGRLIRSASDRGVVAVLDPRLATARYAGFLRAALPKFWHTCDPEQVRRSLAAIDASAPPPLPAVLPA